MLVTQNMKYDTETTPKGIHMYEESSSDISPAELEKGIYPTPKEQENNSDN
jgi:hypothetical protein